jgi:hypothetical protein
MQAQVKEFENGSVLFKLIKLIVPRTGIAKGFRALIDWRAITVRDILFKTDLTVPAFEFIDIIFIIRIFHMEFFAPAYRAFGLGHQQSPSLVCIGLQSRAIGRIAEQLPQPFT